MVPLYNNCRFVNDMFSGIGALNASCVAWDIKKH